MLNYLAMTMSLVTGALPFNEGVIGSNPVRLTTSALIKYDIFKKI